MGPRGWFRERPARSAGEALYASAETQARRPAFYRDFGAPDTTEGRFELYALHVVLLLHRLKGEAGAAETSQALFDAFTRALDDSLREMGVSDTSVGKKMRKLGEAIYGRIKAYDEALKASPDSDGLNAVLRRTVLAGADADPGGIAAYVSRAAASLRAQPLEHLLAGKVNWSEVTP